MSQISAAASLGAKTFCCASAQGPARRGLRPSLAAPLESRRCRRREGEAQLCPVPTLDLQVPTSMRDFSTTATLQAVGMQKGIVQGSSAGKTTEKERKKYLSSFYCLEFTSYSLCPVLKLGQTLSRNTFFSC